MNTKRPALRRGAAGAAAGFGGSATRPGITVAGGSLAVGGLESGDRVAAPFSGGGPPGDRRAASAATAARIASSSVGNGPVSDGGPGGLAGSVI